MRDDKFLECYLKNIMVSTSHLINCRGELLTNYINLNLLTIFMSGAIKVLLFGVNTIVTV